MQKPGFNRFVSERLKKSTGLTASEIKRLAKESEAAAPVPAGAPDEAAFMTFLVKKGYADPDALKALQSEFQELKAKQATAGLDLTPGIRFANKYILDTELGRGGMGLVVKANEISRNRPVAIKLLLSGQHATDSQLERFQKEVAVTGRLRHPNIVEVYACGKTSNNIPYYVMEYVEGLSLDDLIEQKGRLTPPLAMRIVHDVTEGLHHAHRAGIIHRDIKPANILIARGGKPRAKEVGPVSLKLGDRYFERFHAVLTDFGLARELGSAQQLTMTGTTVGTPLYMSPEQAAGRTKEIDGRSDVYSLGATLYHALTGKPPFEGDSDGELYRKIANDSPDPSRRVNKAIPEAVEAILDKAMAKDPKLRYQSAREFGRDVERWLRREKVGALSGRLLFRVRTEFSRRPGRALAVAAGLMLALLSPLLLLLRPAPPKLEFSLPAEAYGTVEVGKPLVLRAIASSGTPPFRYEWSLGDGQRFEGENPTVTPTRSGDLSVQLTLMDARGLSGTMKRNVVVCPNPVRSVFILRLPYGGAEGSGFLVEWNGQQLIVTNDHVASGYGPIFAVAYEAPRRPITDEVRHRAHVVAVDPDNDLALLTLDSSIPGAMPLKLAQSPARDQEEIEVIGFSAAHGVTSKSGKIGQTATSEESVPLACAGVNPGDSGGPVLRRTTSPPEVVGVTVRKWVGAEGLAEAVPIAKVLDLLRLHAACATWSPELRSVRSRIATAGEEIERTAGAFVKAYARKKQEFSELSPSFLKRLSAEEPPQLTEDEQFRLDSLRVAVAEESAAFEELADRLPLIEGALNSFVSWSDQEVHAKRLDGPCARVLMQNRNIAKSFMEAMARARATATGESEDWVKELLAWTCIVLTESAETEIAGSCPSCQGLGTLDCEVCSGSGFCPAQSLYGTAVKSCRACEKTGKCPACQGRKVECQLCEGRKRLWR